MVDRKEVLRELDFGNFVAEKEDDLVSIFTLTEKSKNNIFTSSPPDVILGPKGSGKSAIFQLFSDNEEHVRENFKEIFSENEDKIIIDSGSGQEDELKKGLTRVDSNVDDFAPEEYWKLYFIIKIALLLEENHYNLGGRLSKLLHVIGESNSRKLAPLVNSIYKTVVGPSPGDLNTNVGDIPLDWKNVDTTGLINEEEEFLERKNITIWLFIDRIDQIGNNRNEMKKYIEGLFEAQIFLQDYEKIKPKIFVRSDIWNELHITNRDYLERVELEWDARELLTLINKRMMKNGMVAQYTKDNTARDWDLEKIGEYKKQTHKEIFNSIFVKQIGAGKTGSPTSRWMRKRVTNGKEDKYPREMINFCREAKKAQENKNELPDEKIIGEESLKTALERISEKHVDDVLYSEFEELNPHFDKLKGGQKEYSRPELKNMFDDLDPSGDDAIKRLYKIGLLDPEGHGEYTEDEFTIPLIYRDGLKIVTKGRK